MEGLTLPKIEVDEKELTALEQSASVVTDMAKQIASSILDVPSCKAAQVWCSEQLGFADNLRKRSWLSKIRDEWHKQHAAVCTIIKNYAEPHEAAVRQIVDPAITAFLNEQERQRQIKQKQLDDEARKRDEEARLAKAEELAKQGKVNQADAVLEKPGNFIAPKLQPIELKGRTQRRTWKVREVEGENLIALVKAIAGGAVPIQAIIVNKSFLNKQAQLMDGNLKYPGVECYEEQAGSYRKIA